MIIKITVLFCNKWCCWACPPPNSCVLYTVGWITLTQAFSLVVIYDLSEDRYIDHITINKFFPFHLVQQIDSLLPWVCTVIVTNHRWCHNVLKTWLHLVSNFFVLTTFWCHLLLLNRHTDTWNLPFVKYTQFYCIMYIFLQPENIWTNKHSHPLGCCCLRFTSLQGLIFFSLNWQKAMLNCSVILICLCFLHWRKISQ